MSVPSSCTDPETRAPGIVSCIRFRQRRKVDFPHPAEPRARREAGGETDEEDEQDEDERSCPGEGMPLIIGADGIVEDLKRKRGNRLVQSNRPELIAERSE